jgi:flagellar basal-body rod protein FlgB
LLKRALNVYGKQHQAIAKNVANVNNPDFSRVRTDFSEELKQQMAPGELAATNSKHINSALFKDARLAPEENGEGRIDMNREMTDLASNQIRHELVTRTLQRYFLGLSSAIRGRTG